ncbi:MAG TPA: ABC transporter permease [Flavobacteriales bacterium]|nr:ABC transporter permease [Flavobacteriales bacterium]
MVRAVAWRNVRLRYKSSFLGFLWTLLNPLLFLLIFLLIFSEAFPQVENYPVFALSGLIFWSFFATTSAHVMGALVENAAVLRSLAVPPLVFPLAQLLAGLFNLLMSFIPFAVILHLFGRIPHSTDLLVLPIVLCFGTFILGVSLALSALNVYFRDIGLLWNALLPAFFYITPIAYPADLVPERMRWIAEVNPLYHYIAAFREVLYYGRVPSPDQWVVIAGLAVLASTIGWVLYRALRPGFIANY